MRQSAIKPAIARPAGLFALGFTALVLGVLVYALERPAGSVAILPAGSMHDGAFLGPLAGPLPTFLHTLAFALMTAAFLAPARHARLAACGVWVAFNMAFEISQHPAFAELAGFGLPGAFDPLDLLAAIAGAVAAFIFMELLASERWVRT